MKLYRVVIANTPKKMLPMEYTMHTKNNLGVAAAQDRRLMKTVLRTIL